MNGIKIAADKVSSKQEFQRESVTVLFTIFFTDPNLHSWSQQGKKKMPYSESDFRVTLSN